MLSICATYHTKASGLLAQVLKVRVLQAHSNSYSYPCVWVPDTSLSCSWPKSSPYSPCGRSINRGINDSAVATFVARCCP